MNGKQDLSDDTSVYFHLKVDLEKQGKPFLNTYLKLKYSKKQEWMGIISKRNFQYE